jgi:asparagine synthase (glutamine-hydrolysing)
MCGFVSVIKSPDTKKFIKIFENLKNINKHRGPDSIKILKEKNYLILFRRLSIIDVSKKANQPFEDLEKKIRLIFNGEIYNYIEIKKLLIKKNIKFVTSSDTEVILKAYKYWGINFIKKLRGMFSIVIFDDNKKKIFFIRDPLGQKPLFYSFMKNSLIISSEIKDIVYIYKKKKIKIKENRETVFKYLLRGWANDDNQTFFENIFQFPSGTYSEFAKSKLSKPTKYWDLSSKRKIYNKRKFLSELKANINIHLRSDVPLALTLSSGMDCSSIVKVSSVLKKNKNIKSFSLKLKNYDDESQIIKKYLKENKIKHEFIEVEKFYNKNTLKKIIKSQDEPIISPSHINQYILREEISKRGFKVVLVGEGGDEVLGGYGRMIVPYLVEIYLKKRKKIPKKVYENLYKYFGYTKEIIKKEIDNFINKEKLSNDIEDGSSINFLNKNNLKIPKKLRYYNPLFYNSKNLFKKTLYNHLFRRDMPHIIRAEDRISMAHSIENRNPFIDHKFIEYVFSHNSLEFMKKGIPKFMLRESLKGLLPSYYINNKKIGRPININNYLSKFIKYEFQKLIKSTKILNFDKKRISLEFKKDMKKNNTLNQVFYFRLFNYMYWKKIFFND